MEEKEACTRIPLHAYQSVKHKQNTARQYACMRHAHIACIQAKQHCMPCMRYKASTTVGTCRIGLTSSGLMQLHAGSAHRRESRARVRGCDKPSAICRRQPAGGCPLKDGATSTVRPRAYHAQIAVNHVSARRPEEYCPNRPHSGRTLSASGPLYRPPPVALKRPVQLPCAATMGRTCSSPSAPTTASSCPHEGCRVNSKCVR